MAESPQMGNEMDRTARNTAKQTAQGIRTAKKMAAKAAAGNYAGAAVEAVKNPQAVLALLLAAILVFLMISMFFFYAAPMAMYETLQSLAAKIQEEWDNIRADFYSDDGGFFSRLSSAVGGILARAWSQTTSSLKGIWNALTAEQTRNDSTLDGDTLSDEDTKVMGVEEAAVAVYQRKVDAVKDKLNSRAEMAISRIRASCSGSIYDAGTVNGWVFQNRFPAAASRYVIYDDSWWDDASHYNMELPDNVVEVAYTGVNLVSSSSRVKTRQAVDIIALYSAMHNTTAENVKVFELMKWMGYQGSGSDYFMVGNQIAISIPHWTGTFMPMYLEDEKATRLNHNAFLDLGGNSSDARYDTDVFREYQTSAADLLLVVSTPDLATLQPTITYSVISHTEKVSEASDETVPTGNWYSYLDFPACYENNCYVKLGGFIRGVDYRIDVDSQGRYVRVPQNDGPVADWLAAQNYTTTHTDAQYADVQRVRADISFNLTVSVSVRSAADIKELAGFTNRPSLYEVPEESAEPELESAG